jgi:hypothetical protein
VNCPTCNGKTSVVDRRGPRRRRECNVCKHRFTTFEVLADSLVEPPPPAPKPKVQKTTVKKPPVKKQEPRTMVQEKRRRIEDLLEDRRLKELEDNWDF